jgi:hypothetical protein
LARGRSNQPGHTVKARGGARRGDGRHARRRRAGVPSASASWARTRPSTRAWRQPGGNADAATLQDLFRTEEWWEPYRNAFRVYAVAFDSDRLDVIEGMKTAEFASDLIIREARERKEAVAELVMGKGWPYAAAAAGVELPGRQIPAVLVLAKPIDDAAVRKLAESAGRVLPTDARRDRSPEPNRTAARRSAPEGAGRSTKADGTWAAAAAAVPGLWRWTFAERRRRAGKSATG